MRIDDARGNDLRSCLQRFSSPMTAPPTRQVGGEPADTTQLDHSSSGCCPIQSCQAPMTSAVDPAGYFSENTVMSGAGSVAKVNDVTMPKLPPPPPLSAHNRSPPSTVCCLPSAVTICAATS